MFESPVKVFQTILSLHSSNYLDHNIVIMCMILCMMLVLKFYSICNFYIIIIYYKVIFKKPAYNAKSVLSFFASHFILKTELFQVTSINFVRCNFSQHYFAVQTKTIEKVPCTISNFVRTSIYNTSLISEE